MVSAVNVSEGQIFSKRPYAKLLFLAFSILVMDFFQYEFGSAVYIFGNGLIFLLGLALKLRLPSIFFILVVITAARTRFSYIDGLAFNSIFEGATKYFVISAFIVFVFLRLKVPRKSVIPIAYVLFLLSLGLLLNGFNASLQGAQLFVYFSFLVLPIFISSVISKKSAMEILWLIRELSWLYPVCLLLLMALGRSVSHLGAEVVQIGIMPALFFSINFYRILNERTTLPLILGIFSNLFVIFKAPHSGTIIMVSLSIAFILLMSLRGGSRMKVKPIFGVVVVLMALPVLINLSSSKFLALKFNQIGALMISDSSYMPRSLLIRYIEFQNIRDVSAPFNFIGRGLGGTFTETRATFPTLYQRDFSNDQITSRKFYTPHNVVSNLLLHGGLIGLSVCFFVFVKQFVVLSRRIQFLAPSAFIAFYGLFWGMKVVLVWAFLVGAADRIYRR